MKQHRLLWAFKFLLPYKYLYLFGILCSLAMGAAQLIIPWVRKLIIDDGLIQQKQRSPNYSDLDFWRGRGTVYRTHLGNGLSLCFRNRSLRRGYAHRHLQTSPHAFRYPTFMVNAPDRLYQG